MPWRVGIRLIILSCSNLSNTMKILAWVKSLAIFGNWSSWSCGRYLCSIVVVSELTYACFHSVSDLKAAQMYAQRCLIRELRLQEFELGQNICLAEEGAIDPNTVTRWFKKFYSGYKNLDYQARSGRPTTVISKGVCQATEANLASGIRGVSVQSGSSPSRCTIGKYSYWRNVHGTFITYIHNVEHIKNIGISKFENT